MRRHIWVIAAGVLALVAILVVRNQVKVYRGRQAAALAMEQRQRLAQQAPDVVRRQALLDMLQPVALANCQLERFGETHDGGYLMCANLLNGVASGYSYGISGYDQWGCDISTRLGVPVHQYDCFNLTQPVCPSGRTVFHAECVGDTAGTLDGRTFDTMKGQFERNGDGSRRLVLKMDVEGAEWRSLLSAPDEVLAQIDQLAIEFHWLKDDDGRWEQEHTHLLVLQRLKQYFEIAHLHFNNAGCVGGLEPFPTWAYEVLFVSKRLAVVDPSRTVGGPHPLDALNNPSLPDCRPTAR